MLAPYRCSRWSRGDYSTSATRCNLVGALRSNALSGLTRPERALVFLVAVLRERVKGSRWDTLSQAALPPQRVATNIGLSV